MTGYVFKFQKIEKQSKDWNKLKFSMNSLIFSCLICVLNLHFAQKLSRKAKRARGRWNRKKLLQTPNVAQKLLSRITTCPPGWWMIGRSVPLSSKNTSRYISMHMSQVAHQAGAYPILSRFCSMKRLGVSLLPPGYNVSGQGLNPDRLTLRWAH